MHCESLLDESDLCEANEKSFSLHCKLGLQHEIPEFLSTHLTSLINEFPDDEADAFHRASNRRRYEFEILDSN